MMIVFNNGSSHLEMGRERERESAIERKMQYFPIANRFDRMHHSTLK